MLYTTLHVAHCHSVSRHEQIWASQKTSKSPVSPGLCELEARSNAVERLHFSIASSSITNPKPLPKSPLPLLAEVVRLANKQGVEARSRRRGVRDGLAAPFYCCGEQARLRLAQRFRNHCELRYGLCGQEIHNGRARIVASPEHEKWGAAAPRGAGRNHCEFESAL